MTRQEIPDDLSGEESLQPIVAALVKAGNRVVADFRDMGSDSQCWLADPIDFDLVHQRFNLSAQFVVNRDGDSISNRHRCSIKGRRGWYPRIIQSALFYARRAVAEAAPGRVALAKARIDDAYELLIGVLLDAGNTLEYFEWTRRGPGKQCRLGQPIDFALLRRTFEFPDSYTLDETHDRVLETTKGYLIEGPQTPND